jgi:hypothetical protein
LALLAGWLPWMALPLTSVDRRWTGAAMLVQVCALLRALSLAVREWEKRRDGVCRVLGLANSSHVIPQMMK